MRIQGWSERDQIDIYRHTLSMMPRNKKSSSGTFPEGQDDLLLFWMKSVDPAVFAFCCFLPGSPPALRTWCSRRDSNAELGIRNPLFYPVKLREHEYFQGGWKKYKDLWYQILFENQAGCCLLYTSPSPRDS